MREFRFCDSIILFSVYYSLWVQQFLYMQTFKLWTLKDAKVCSINFRHEWKLQLAFHLLLLMILQLYRLPPLCLLQSITLLAYSPDASSCMPSVILYYCTFQGTVLRDYFFFFGLLFMSCLCEKYYKPITVQYYIVNCVSWICKLTLLDLMNELDCWTHSQNKTHLYIGCFLNSLKNKDWRLLAEK